MTVCSARIPGFSPCRPSWLSMHAVGRTPGWSAMKARLGAVHLGLAGRQCGRAYLHAQQCMPGCQEQMQGCSNVHARLAGDVGHGGQEGMHCLVPLPVLGLPLNAGLSRAEGSWTLGNDAGILKEAVVIYGGHVFPYFKQYFGVIGTGPASVTSLWTVSGHDVARPLV